MPLTSLAMLIALELALAGAIGYTLAVLLQVVDPVVLVVLIGLRASLSALHLARMLAPIRAWPASDGDDRALVEIDRRLASVRDRAVVVYALGWGLCVLSATALARIGWPQPVAVGPIDLVSATLMVITASTAAPPLLGALLDAAFDGPRTAVRRRMIARKLELERRPSMSVAARVTALSMGMVGSVLAGAAAVAVSLHARGLRAEVLARERGRAAELAARLRSGELDERELDHARIEPTPPAPLRALGSAPAGETLALTDARHEQVIAAAPIDATRWLVIHAEIDQELGYIVTIVVSFLFITLIPGTLASVGLARSLSTPLAELDEATRRMVERGDLGNIERIASAQDDELGALADNFNRMLDMLELLAGAATAVAEGDLRVELDSPGELPDAFRSMLAQLHELVAELRASATATATAATEISTATTANERAVERQAERIMLVTHTVATLAETAEDITTSASEVLTNAEGTLATTETVGQTIDSLEAATGRIAELLGLIHDIAQRSDLLALNGSLEATRAGEAGRGFALLAAEMRRLAERVGGTITDVRARVVEIEGAGQDTVEATARNRELAEGTAAAARRIAELTQRQNQETGRVSTEVFEVAEFMIAMSTSSKDAQVAAQHLRERAATIEDLSAQFTLREAAPITPQSTQEATPDP